MLEDAPEGLVVEVDDRVHVELGPARARNGGPAALGLLVAVYVASAALLWAGLTAGWWVLVGGTLLAATLRMRAFGRHEAPLRLSFDERRLLLERHFRDRVLWRRELDWASVDGIARRPGEVCIDLRGARALRLSAAFRTEAQLDWVARRLGEALGSHRLAADAAREAADVHGEAMAKLLGFRNRTR